jgi:hypothetical protein
MVNKPRIKGTTAETAVVNYLRDNGFAQAERRSLKGNLDQGDVTGCPGLCVEVKWANGGLKMAKWLAETGIERINAEADHGILVVKPAGVGVVNAGFWFAAMDLLDHESLMDKARAESQATVECSTPTTYQALAIGAGLTVVARPFGDHLYALTMVPRGAKGQPNRYFRTMYFRDMVRLLRLAGYGDPEPRPGPAATPDP